MQTGKPVDVLDLLQESALTWIGLIIALGVLVWLIFRIRAWFREGDDPTDDLNKLLAHAREMERQGELTAEEFRSIKGRVSKGLDR